MTLIDADKFLAYLIYSKHIDSLTCGEVKEAIKMCEVDVLDKIRAEIENADAESFKNPHYHRGLLFALEIIEKYIGEKE